VPSCAIESSRAAIYPLVIHIARKRLRLERPAPRSGLGIFQCRHKIFLAFAFEFLLGSFEARDACGDFFALLSGAIRLFDHAHPFLILVPSSLVGVIGARIGKRRCGIVTGHMQSEYKRCNRTLFRDRGG